LIVAELRVGDPGLRKAQLPHQRHRGREVVDLQIEIVLRRREIIGVRPMRRSADDEDIGGLVVDERPGRIDLEREWMPLGKEGTGSSSRTRPERSAQQHCCEQKVPNAHQAELPMNFNPVTLRSAPEFRPAILVVKIKVGAHCPENFCCILPNSGSAAQTRGADRGTIGACPPKRTARRRVLFEIVNAASEPAPDVTGGRCNLYPAFTE
jgi:hypothetical protein